MMRDLIFYGFQIFYIIASIVTIVKAKKAIDAEKREKANVS